MLCSLETLMQNCMFCIIFVPKQSLFTTIYPRDLMRSFECCFLILTCIVAQYEKLKRAKMYKLEKYKIFLGWSVQGSLFRWKSSERFKIHSVRKLAEENDSIMSPWSLHQMERCERAGAYSCFKLTYTQSFHT